MPNPNEMLRLEEELKHHRKNFINLEHSKKSREYHLGEIRKISKQLGLPDPPKYNGGRK